MRTRLTALVVLFFSSTGLVSAQYTAEYGRRQRASADLRSHQNAVLLIHANSQTNRVEGGFRQDHSFTTSLGLKILSERCSRSTAILAIAGYSCRLTRLSSPFDFPGRSNPDLQRKRVLGSSTCSTGTRCGASWQRRHPSPQTCFMQTAFAPMLSFLPIF